MGFAEDIVQGTIQSKQAGRATTNANIIGTYNANLAEQQHKDTLQLGAQNLTRLRQQQTTDTSSQLAINANSGLTLENTKAQVAQTALEKIELSIADYAHQTATQATNNLNQRNIELVKRDNEIAYYQSLKKAAQNKRTLGFAKTIPIAIASYFEGPLGGIIADKQLSRIQ